MVFHLVSYGGVLAETGRNAKHWRIAAVDAGLPQKPFIPLFKL